MKPVWKCTLVQHSGFTIGRNPEFEHAVQTTHLHTAAAVGKIQRAGGILFDPPDSLFLEGLVNYPPDVDGLIPHVEGTFSRIEHEGQLIYIPTTADHERLAAALIPAV